MAKQLSFTTGTVKIRATLGFCAKRSVGMRSEGPRYVSDRSHVYYPVTAMLQPHTVSRLKSAHKVQRTEPFPDWKVHQKVRNLNLFRTEKCTQRPTQINFSGLKSTHKGRQNLLFGPEKCTQRPAKLPFYGLKNAHKGQQTGHFSGTMTSLLSTNTIHSDANRAKI